MVDPRAPNPKTRRSVDYRIDPFDLYLFTAVIEHGTITAAASAVNLSLAAASARLKLLEDATGTRLLERSKSGAVPTDAGRALARHAGRVLAELESLHVGMAGFGRGLRGTVKLLCNTAAMTEALPRTIGRFLAATPDLDVDVQELPSEAAVDALRRGRADIAIVADHVDVTGLIALPWLDDRLVALIPRAWHRAWPPGHRRSITWAELLVHPLVGLGRDSGISRFLATQASRGGRVPRHRVRLGGFDALVPLVEAGVGAAVMPEGAARRHATAGTRVVPLSDPWARRRLLVCMTPQGQAMDTVNALAQALLASTRDGEGAGARPTTRAARPRRPRR